MSFRPRISRDGESWDRSAKSVSGASMIVKAAGVEEQTSRAGNATPPGRCAANTAGNGRSRSGELEESKAWDSSAQKNSWSRCRRTKLLSCPVSCRATRLMLANLSFSGSLRTELMRTSCATRLSRCRSRIRTNCTKPVCNHQSLSFQGEAPDALGDIARRPLEQSSPMGDPWTVGADKRTVEAGVATVLNSQGHAAAVTWA